MNTKEGIGINRTHKDRVLRMLLMDKKILLELYNALEGTDYGDEEDIIITTLDDVIFMKLKNDISFIIDSNMSLYEHQSTFNPNMPIRGLFYFGELYRVWTRDVNLYGSKLIQIPTPTYIVFYNGQKDIEDRTVLKLSDAFAVKKDHIGLEVEAVMLNINFGHNSALMEKCRALLDYSLYVEKIKEYQDDKSLTLEDAVNKAIDECIQEGILREFLEQRREEVLNMTLTEYDEKQVMQWFKEEGMEEGFADGLEQGIKV